MNSSFFKALSELPEEEFERQMKGLCGSLAWCQRMAAQRPYASLEQLHSASDRSFDHLRENDWLEAFASHPVIGDVDSLKMKFAGNSKWSRGEQSGVDAASEATLVELARGNQDYLRKFGYIFIVCASGKSASEMLAMLQERIDNDPAEELLIAAGEQRKITHLRIQKLAQDNL